MSTTVLWLREDLRLDDNPALAFAAERGAVVPIFIEPPKPDDAWPLGAASRWWRRRSLAALSTSFERLGVRLILRRGHAVDVLTEIARAVGADTITFNRRYEPALAQLDEEVLSALGESQLDVRTFNGRLLHEPWQVRKKSGGPYQVFSAFHHRLDAKPEPQAPLPAPTSLKSPRTWPRSGTLDSLEETPSRDFTGLAEVWQPGEAGAQAQLERFLEHALEDYATKRDLPAQAGASRLSPHLRHGELSPRRLYHTVRARMDAGASDEQGNAYLRQVAWREFAYHLLHHFPETPTKPLRAKYARMPFIDVETDAGRRKLGAWQVGATGYPIVDAGMRELWQTGFMHNRVRMVVASFLVKDLLIDWREGARWFWDTLVDADLANNTLGWQWAAGCGADAAPYFRVFNPVLQSRKFDAEGAYIRRFCPELASLPDRHVHEPWRAPPELLTQARITLGESYPRPIVDHAQARSAALEALSHVTDR